MSATITMRAAAEHEMPQLLAFIRELAVYEHLEHEVVASAADLSAALFGPHRYAEVVFACLDGEPMGFALFFHNYSTFRAQPGHGWRCRSRCWRVSKIFLGRRWNVRAIAG